MECEEAISNSKSNVSVDVDETQVQSSEAEYSTVQYISGYAIKMERLIVSFEPKFAFDFCVSTTEIFCLII